MFKTIFTSLVADDVGGGLVERAAAVDVLDVDAVLDKPALVPLLDVLVAVPLGEAPLRGPDDAEHTGKLGGATPEGLLNVDGGRLPAPHGHDDLADLDPGGEALGLAVGTTHAGLEPIGTGARKHLVDAEHVVRVGPDAEVEGILTGHLGDVLVAGNAGGLKSLGGKLLKLVGEHVHAGRELVHGGLLLAEVIDPDLGVGDTTAVPRLDVRLVLLVAVAARRTAWWLQSKKEKKKKKKTNR